ncbi:MAG: hypothetical protein M1817_006183 [Caeruleum heppii]|nr:MAG: hypothetical protein M1817_006183 [Caeruleum heppii]
MSDGGGPGVNAEKAQAGILSASEIKEPWSVQSALARIGTPQPSSHPTSPLHFFHLLTRLKTTPREGWRRFNIEHGESISDHMYRMSVLTMLAPSSLSSSINVPHCTKMALVHDMAESLVGDITPMDKVAKDEKSRRERTTMEYITSHLLGNVDGGTAGNGLMEIWEEYEESKTLEARFVHDIDKMELLLQMMEYERMGEGKKDLGEFVRVSERVVLPEVRDWCRDLLKEREEYWKEVGTVPSGIDMRNKLGD